MQRCAVLSGSLRRPQQPFPGVPADVGQESPGIGDRGFRVVPQNLLAGVRGEQFEAHTTNLISARLLGRLFAAQQTDLQSS